jgi:hypothetical protein
LTLGQTLVKLHVLYSSFLIPSFPTRFISASPQALSSVLDILHHCKQPNSITEPDFYSNSLAHLAGSDTTTRPLLLVRGTKQLCITHRYISGQYHASITSTLKNNISSMGRLGSAQEYGDRWNDGNGYRTVKGKSAVRGLFRGTTDWKRSERSSIWQRRPHCRYRSSRVEQQSFVSLTATYQGSITPHQQVCCKISSHLWAVWAAIKNMEAGEKWKVVVGR